MSDPQQLDLAAVRARHRPSFSQPPHCLGCAKDFPCPEATLADALNAQAERLARAEEWQSSVSGALRSWSMFDAGEWGGDKSGWGYHLELIGFLIRHYAQHHEVLLTYGSHLERCTIGKGTPCSCGFDSYLFGAEGEVAPVRPDPDGTIEIEFRTADLPRSRPTILLEAPDA